MLVVSPAEQFPPQPMSTFKRILALTFIFICTSIAWVILGATIFQRTYGQDDNLRSKVSSNWGTAQVQEAASASYIKGTQEIPDSRGQTLQLQQHSWLPLDSTRANVALQLDYRLKGLLWYSTYKTDFSGEYAFHNDSGQDQDIIFRFPLPASQTMCDKVVLMIDGVPAKYTITLNAVQTTQHLAAGQAATLKVGYSSQGMDRWSYKFTTGIAQVHDFQLTMTTNFQDIDFPDNTLSPTAKKQTDEGWKLDWNYDDLLSGYEIGMVMPQKLQPGPLAGRISFFAPVSLFFFFFLVFIITTKRGMDLHPMNYFFLAASFFAFHLLMAYLVDHMSVHWSFFISAIVSLALTISYMRLVAGPKFALMECGLAQLVYLVLFSYAFFFKGYTGLTVTIGSIVTLFVVMQMTGRINWTERFARTARAPVMR